MPSIMQKVINFLNQRSEEKAGSKLYHCPYCRIRSNGNVCLTCGIHFTPPDLNKPLPPLPYSSGAKRTSSTSVPKTRDSYNEETPSLNSSSANEPHPSDLYPGVWGAWDDEKDVPTHSFPKRADSPRRVDPDKHESKALLPITFKSSDIYPKFWAWSDSDDEEEDELPPSFPPLPLPRPRKTIPPSRVVPEKHESALPRPRKIPSSRVVPEKHESAPPRPRKIPSSRGVLEKHESAPARPRKNTPPSRVVPEKHESAPTRPRKNTPPSRVVPEKHESAPPRPRKNTPPSRVIPFTPPPTPPPTPPRPRPRSTQPPIRVIPSQHENESLRPRPLRTSLRNEENRTSVASRFSNRWEEEEELWMKQVTFEEAVRETVRRIAPHMLEAYEAAVLLERRTSRMGFAR